MGCSSPPKQQKLSVGAGLLLTKVYSLKKALLTAADLTNTCFAHTHGQMPPKSLLPSICFLQTPNSSCTGLSHSSLVCAVFQLLSHPSCAQVFSTLLAPALISFWEYTSSLSPLKVIFCCCYSQPVEDFWQCRNWFFLFKPVNFLFFLQIFTAKPLLSLSASRVFHESFLTLAGHPRAGGIKEAWGRLPTRLH